MTKYQQLIRKDSNLMNIFNAPDDEYEQYLADEFEKAYGELYE